MVLRVEDRVCGDSDGGYVSGLGSGSPNCHKFKDEQDMAPNMLSGRRLREIEQIVAGYFFAFCQAAGCFFLTCCQAAGFLAGAGRFGPAAFLGEGRGAGFAAGAFFLASPPRCA